MAHLTRRLFLSAAPVGLASFGKFTETAQSGHAQLVWNTSDWRIAEFRELAEPHAQIKQLYDFTSAKDDS